MNKDNASEWTEFKVGPATIITLPTLQSTFRRDGKEVTIKFMHQNKGKYNYSEKTDGGWIMKYGLTLKEKLMLEASYIFKKISQFMRPKVVSITKWINK